MEAIAFICIVIGLLCLLLVIGGIVADRWHGRPPMARYVNTDILPPPSPNCERRGNIVEFRRAVQ